MTVKAPIKQIDRGFCVYWVVLLRMAKHYGYCLTHTHSFSVSFMSGHSRVKLLVAAVFILVSGCQSNRFAFLSPPSAATVSTQAPPLVPIVAASEPQAQEEREEPVLVAELPVEHLDAQRLPRAIQQILVSGLSPKKELTALPDTSTVRVPTEPTPDQIRAASTLTTVVKIVGFSLLILGVALIITAFTGTFGGWVALGYLLYGVLALALSIPFLVFRSKKSVSYRLRQKRKAERRAAKE
jgi:hypothetical protein